MERCQLLLYLERHCHRNHRNHRSNGNVQYLSGSSGRSRAKGLRAKIILMPVWSHNLHVQLHIHTEQHQTTTHCTSVRGINLHHHQSIRSQTITTYALRHPTACTHHSIRLLLRATCPTTISAPRRQCLLVSKALPDMRLKMLPNRIQRTNDHEYQSDHATDGRGSDQESVHAREVKPLHKKRDKMIQVQEGGFGFKRVPKQNKTRPKGNRSSADDSNLAPRLVGDNSRVKTTGRKSAWGKRWALPF
jgi:hypothetical protein